MTQNLASESDDAKKEASDAAPPIMSTPTKHIELAKGDDPTMDAQDQREIAAASASRGHDGTQPNGDQAYVATSVALVTSPSSAKNDGDSAAVVRKLNDDHAKQNGSDHLRANNGRADSVNDGGKNNRPVPRESTKQGEQSGAQSAEQTAEQPDVVTGIGDGPPPPQGGNVGRYAGKTMPQGRLSRKSQRTRVPTFKCAIDHTDAPAPAPDVPRPEDAATPNPRTPQELYLSIKNSRDKLFFVTYSHSKDPLIINKPKNRQHTNEYSWHLARVDLSTCAQLEETKRCAETGKYYVEFYTKASYDQGILLAGNPLENGVPSAKMKPKPDSESRYWLEWHDYHFDKNGDMIVGKAKEFLPNSKKAIHRRLTELHQRQRRRLASPGSDDGDDEDRLMSEYHPNFEKYTTWADVTDLMDAGIRLVGPFDFDDVKPPPWSEKDLALLSKEMRDLFTANHANLYVRDRVPLCHWQELTKALKGKDIDPPTFPVEPRRKKSRVSGSKRVQGEAKVPGKKVTDTDPVVDQDGDQDATENEPLLSFPATPTMPPMSKTKNDPTVVSQGNLTKDILLMVKAILTRTRQATADNGEAYYVFGEVKEAMNQAFGNWTVGTASASSREGGNVALPAANSSEPLEGLSLANFTPEEIASFPMAFGYDHDDPSGISERNAKIATYDYEKEQRRLKRKGESKSTKGRGRPRKVARTTSKGNPSSKKGSN